MSYNLVDPTTGDLTRVAGSINTSIIPSDASATNKLVTNTQLTSKMSCYTWDTKKTLRAVFYEVTDRDIMPDVNDTVGKRVIARYGNVLINRITQLNGIKNFYWDNTLVLSCPYNDDVTKLTAILEIFVGTTSWQQLATTNSTLKTIQLSGSVDCNTLTEPGLYTASAGAVISATNIPADIGSAVQLDGGFSVLVTKTNVTSVYYGMQMFIPYGSDSPFIRKSYYLNGQYWTDWQQLATMDNLPTAGVGTGINKQDIVSGDANTTINIPAYHFCSGLMYLQMNGIGTALLSYATDFDRNLYLNIIAGAGISLTGLTLYKNTELLGTFSMSGEYIVFAAQYHTVIRTNYASL